MNLTLSMPIKPPNLSEKEKPNNKSLQVCGLIHDLGKILFKFNEPSWSVVGDTYAVGCKFPDTIVYYETMKENPDYTNPLYNHKIWRI